MSLFPNKYFITYINHLFNIHNIFFEIYNFTKELTKGKKISTLKKRSPGVINPRALDLLHKYQECISLSGVCFKMVQNISDIVYLCQEKKSPQEKKWIYTP
jgi:hypothetical protein